MHLAANKRFENKIWIVWTHDLSIRMWTSCDEW